MLLNGNSGGWSECAGDAGQSYQAKEKKVYSYIFFTHTYNLGQKSLGQYCNIHIFLSFYFFGFLLKLCILFKILFSCSSPSPNPTYTKLKLSKKFWIHASNIVCGVRGGAGPV